MTAFRVSIFLAFAIIIGVPFALRPDAARDGNTAAGRTLVVITPHVPQIRTEFALAFDRWHRREHGEGVRIDYRVPGGTSEIVKQLESQYAAAAKAGFFDFADPANPTAAAGTIPFDVMFGGGSYDHTRVRDGVKVQVAGTERRIPMSIPAGFAPDILEGWFGDNSVGAQQLYDPGQYWIGTALSGFGIVYNADLYARLRLPAPTSFEDLTRPELMGLVVLADPRQSGSVTTTLDSILSNHGWDEGWRIIREMCANSRSFTNSATKPPIDVSAGEAAAGLAIDFYGRGQSQAVLARGQDPATARVGYVDPRGTVYIDADPISILRAGPSPDLARRFIEFLMTDEAQALWQFPAASDPASASNPIGAGGERMGPLRSELRRMPVRRAMYADATYRRAMIDGADPFELASKVKPAGWRSGIGIMMGAFAIDIAREQRDAWRALWTARRDPRFPADVREEMETLFYAFPETTLADGRVLAFTPETFKDVRGVWRDPAAQARCEIEYTAFHRRNYRRVVELAGRSAGDGRADDPAGVGAVPPNDSRADRR
mgnify:CR=1 FL=1